MKLVFLSLPVFLLITIGSLFSWLENHFLSCPFKQLSGIDCPGCGIQRSFLALVKGDLLQSFKFYPATIPIVFLFIFTVFHLKFDYKNGAHYIKLIYIGIAIIIVANYLYKIFTHQLI